MAKLSFTLPILALNILSPFNKHTSISLPYILLSYITISFTSPIPFTPTDDTRYIPSDDPNVTNLMVSHYNFEKQHNLRQLNLPNVKQCTEASSNIQHANVQARVYVRAKAKRIRAFKCESYSKKEKNGFKVMSSIDVLIELSGIITLCHYLLLLIILNVKTLLDISMELTIKK